MSELAKIDVLKAMRLGERVAEEEIDSLESYFIETNQWNEIFDGEKDLVFGPKGGGKSALYTLLNKKSPKLKSRSIFVSLAENPKGATVFKQLSIDPPPSEGSFTALWKTYILLLVADVLRENDIKNDESNALISTLNSTGLLPVRVSREGLFSGVRKFINDFTSKSVQSIEGSVRIDPITGLPVPTGKLIFENQNGPRLDQLPIDELLAVANDAFRKSGKKVWVLFDRLDVAFSESKELEKNALRSLFRTYRDLRSHDNICLKLFIRDDV